MYRFQILIDLSKLPETIYFPSGVTVTNVTYLLWPLIVSIYAPVSKLNTLIVLSKLPEIIYLLSGVMAIELTGLMCLVIVVTRMRF